MSTMTPSNATTPNSLTSTTTSGTNLSPSPVPTSGGLTFDQVENYWINAGGNPQAASMAAAVSDASSGLNPGASRTNPDGTTSIGLWLIPQNGTPPGSTDPTANARAAVQLSGNGTDWSQWCVTWSDNNCGQDGGTYLGSGSNALGSLGTQLEPSAYNVIGSTPSGSGTGASAATSASSTTGTTSGTSHLTLYIIIAVLIIGLAIYFGRKQMTAEPEPEGMVGAVPGAENQPKPVVIPAHVRGLPSADTSGPYAS